MRNTAKSRPVVTHAGVTHMSKKNTEYIITFNVVHYKTLLHVSWNLYFHFSKFTNNFVALISRTASIYKVPVLPELLLSFYLPSCSVFRFFAFTLHNIEVFYLILKKNRLIKILFYVGNKNQSIFIVTPCINDIRHFIIQLMHTT